MVNLKQMVLTPKASMVSSRYQDSCVSLAYFGYVNMSTQGYAPNSQSAVTTYLVVEVRTNCFVHIETI